MLNLNPSDTLTQEVSNHLHSIETSLRLKELNRTPGCPVAAVLSKIPGLPREVVQKLQLHAAGLVIAGGQNYTRFDYADKIAGILKGNGGNWIELIYDTRPADQIMLHQVRLYLYQAIYHHHLKTTAEPLFAFRNTLLYTDDIGVFYQQLVDASNASSPCQISVNERSLYQAVQTLVDQGEITELPYRVVKIKPRFVLS